MPDEIVDGPEGPLRVPASIGDGNYADNFWLNFEHERVQLTFYREEPADVGRVAVARIWLERDRFYEWVDALSTAKKKMLGG